MAVDSAKVAAKRASLFHTNETSHDDGKKKEVKYKYPWMFKTLVLFVRLEHKGSNKAFAALKGASDEVQGMATIVDVDDENAVSAADKKKIVTGLPTMLVNARAAFKKNTGKRMEWNRFEGARAVVKFLNEFLPPQRSRNLRNGRSKILMARSVRTDSVDTERGTKHTTTTAASVSNRKATRTLLRTAPSLPRTGTLSEADTAADMKARQSSFNNAIAYIRENAERIGADVDGSGGAYDPASKSLAPADGVHESAARTRAVFGGM